MRVVPPPESSNQTEPSPTRQNWQRLAALPAIVLFLVVVKLALDAAPSSFEHPLLLMSLNLLFATAISLFVSGRIAHSFLEQGRPELLLLGCGLFIWGLAGLLGTIAGLVASGDTAFNSNTLVTIHNSCVWMSALFHLTAALLPSKWRLVLGSPGRWLTLAYLATLLLALFITHAAIAHWTPLFFIPGEGGTFTRQWVLGSAIALFLLTAMIFRLINPSSLPPFGYWYSQALVLFAIGLFAVLLQKATGSAVGWVGRGTQYLGSLYLLFAALRFSQQPYGGGLFSFDWRESSVFHQAVMAGSFAAASTAAAAGLHLFFLPGRGLELSYVTFFPAVLFASFFGGFWAGVTTTLLSSLVVIAFWHAAVAHPVHNPEDLLNTIFFVVSGVAVALMVKVNEQAQAEKAAALREAAIQEERIKAAELLEESEARLTNIIEGTRAGSWDWQIETGAVVVNERWAEMVGYRLEELAPISIETWTGLAHPDDLVQSNRQLDEVFRGERPYYDFEGRMKHRNGQWLWIRGRGKVVEWSKEGKPLRMAGSHIDVSDHKQAEEMLASLGRELQVILDTAPIGLIKTIDRKIVWINAICLKHLQYSREEMLSQTSEKLFPSREGYDRFGKDAYAGLSQGKTVQAELSLCRKDGSVILVRYAGKAVDTRDLSQGIIWVFEDITDLRQIETAFRERVEIYSAFFEKSCAVKLLFDPTEGRIVDANPAALNFYGYAREQILGMSIADISLAPTTAISELMHNAACRQHTDMPLPQRHRLASGKIRDVEVYPSPITINKRTLLHAIIHDVTARKEMEEALRTSQEEALAADRAKSNLLTTVAHEFRTPLSLLTSSLDILDQYGKNLSPEEIHRQNAFIRSASRQLATLANTVLNYSEKLREKMDDSTTLININEYCHTLADEVLAAWGAQHDFKLQISPEVALLVTNGKLLRRVLENLLINAFQYTPPGKRVSLKVDRKGEWLQMTIDDQGIGIEQRDLPRIFESFFRGNNVGQRRGMGLGLSIVKDDLTQLKGTIQVNSTVGKGTTIEMSIPGLTDR